MLCAMCNARLPGGSIRVSIATRRLDTESADLRYSEALLQAAVEGAGTILTPDWQAGAAVRDGTLVQILRQWEGPAPGGIYAVMPSGRLVPTKTRVFVDQITHAIQAAWEQ